MYEHFQKEKEKKKNMTKDEKEALKKEKLALEEQYGYCFLDGRKEKVGNFRIEPPGLFRGRGKHPKTGCLKVFIAGLTSSQCFARSSRQFHYLLNLQLFLS